MKRPKLSLLAALAVLACGAGLNSGCYTTIDAAAVARADAGPVPADYAQQIDQWLRYNLKDYDSANIQLGEPAKDYSNSLQGHNVITYGWMVAAQINAKNSFGGYTGFTPYQFFFVEGGLVIVRQWDPELRRFYIISRP
jgi:hypothetical protein